MPVRVLCPSHLSLVVPVAMSTRPCSAAPEAGCCPGSLLHGQPTHTTALFVNIWFLVHFNNITDGQCFRKNRSEALLPSGKGVPMAIYHFFLPPYVTTLEDFVINFPNYAVAPAFPCFVCEITFILNFPMYYSHSKP